MAFQIGSLARLTWQGFAYPWRLLAGRLLEADRTPASQLAAGEGRVLETQEGKLAVYREETGELQALSPICTHLRCVVEFNDAEKTWDCPCHGSRFDTAGQVIRGPARRPLERKPLDVA
jgi:3-phenylpropionate/trans-cinnamate dioxygenase ferredoxin reductase subunit